jgi:repressor LexA
MRSKNAEWLSKIRESQNDFLSLHGRIPTVRELEQITGIPRATVQRYRKELERSDPANEVSFSRPRADVIRAPLLGTVACGIPRYAEEYVEEYVELPRSLFGAGEFFLLHAEGDSMIEAGISSGDLVVVRKQDTAANGEIVVALIDGEEATLKRYYPEPEQKRIRLHPANHAFPDRYVADCLIQGVAVSVIKKLA